jgi:hypothetical protein
VLVLRLRQLYNSARINVRNVLNITVVYITLIRLFPGCLPKGHKIIKIKILARRLSRRRSIAKSSAKFSHRSAWGPPGGNFAGRVTGHTVRRIEYRSTVSLSSYDIKYLDILISNQRAQTYK